MTQDISTLSIEEKEKLFSLLMQKEVLRARSNFYSFVKLMAPFILPEGYKDGLHIRILCDKLEDVFRSIQDPKRRGKKLMLSMSPGSMKSILVNRLFPAWCYGNKPEMRFISVGHSVDLARDNAAKPLRDLLRSVEYQAVFPNVEVDKNSASASYWETTAGGTFLPAGGGSSIAGRRAHISITDDVLSEQSAFSETERARINRWYVPGLRSRLLPGGAEIIVMTRWMQDDLMGYLKETEKGSKEPWEIFSIPALLTEESSKYFRSFVPEDSDKYLPDTSYWPEFWPTDELQEKRANPSMTLSTWNALYMQNPTPDEGNIIKREAFKVWKKPYIPDLEYILVSLDTAFSTKDTADYSALTIWGIFIKYEEDLKGVVHKVPSMILLYSEKGRWEFPDLCKKVREINTEFKPDGYLIEKKASGQSLIQELRRWGFPVIEFMPDRDKISRTHAITPFLSAGRIYVPENRRWADVLVEEVAAFPFGSNDDLHDTFTQAVLWMRDSYLLGNEGYQVVEDEEDNIPARSYWTSLTR